MGQDQREEGTKKTPTQLGQEHCAALCQVGRALAAMPVGLGTALGRRLSRVRKVGDRGKTFPMKTVGTGPRSCCCPLHWKVSSPHKIKP